MEENENTEITYTVAFESDIEKTPLRIAYQCSNCGKVQETHYIDGLPVGWSILSISGNGIDEIKLSKSNMLKITSYTDVCFCNDCTKEILERCNL